LAILADGVIAVEKFPMGAIAFVDCRDFVFRAGHDVKAKGMVIRIVAISWCDLATHCLINLDGNLLGVRVGSRGREQVPAICQRGMHIREMKNE
jgi:hypothetical protein